MSNLYNLLNEYDKKLVDKDFISRAYNYLLEDNPKLNNYISKLIITNNKAENNVLGRYIGNSDKKIIIYLNNILNRNTQSNNINRTNILALEALKHEFTHADQIRRIDEGKKDITTETIKLSYLNYCTEKGYFYPLKEYDMKYINFLTKENYYISPNERNAEIESWKYIVNLLKNKRTSDELLFSKSNLYYSYIRGYKDNGLYINCPTYEFLLELRLIREFKIIKQKVETKNYSLDTRLNSGLPITKDELENEILKKLKLVKKYKR